jgi:hypothetical protein
VAGEHHAGPHKSATSHSGQGHQGHNGDNSAYNNQHGQDNYHGSHHSPDGKAHPQGQNHGGKSPTKDSNQKPGGAPPVKRRSLLMRLSISLGIVDGTEQSKDENAPVAAVLRDLVSSHALLEENTSPELSRANSDGLANTRPYPGFLHDVHAQEEEDAGNSQKRSLKPVKAESKANFFARSFQAISGRTSSTAASSAAGNNLVSHDSQDALSPTSHSPVLNKVRSMTSPDTTPRARQHVDGHDAFHGRTDALPNKSPAMFPEDAAMKTPPRHAHAHESVTAQSKGNAMGKIWHSLMGNNKVEPGK